MRECLILGLKLLQSDVAFVITKSRKFYFKVREPFYYKLRESFYYKEGQISLQSAADVTRFGKRGNYYKVGHYKCHI